MKKKAIICDMDKCNKEVVKTDEGYRVGKAIKKPNVKPHEDLSFCDTHLLELKIGRFINKIEERVTKLEVINKTLCAGLQEIAHHRVARLEKRVDKIENKGGK